MSLARTATRLLQILIGRILKSGIAFDNMWCPPDEVPAKRVARLAPIIIRALRVSIEGLHEGIESQTWRFQVQSAEFSAIL
jgi:hypothetical protein